MRGPFSTLPCYLAECLLPEMIKLTLIRVTIPSTLSHESTRSSAIEGLWGTLARGRTVCEGTPAVRAWAGALAARLYHGSIGRGCLVSDAAPLLNHSRESVGPDTRESCSLLTTGRSDKC